jgi:hypothetical protein
MGRYLIAANGDGTAPWYAGLKSSALKRNVYAVRKIRVSQEEGSTKKTMFSTM